MDFHLAAVLLRGKTVVRIGTNQNKTHPKFLRTYPDGHSCGQLHAEMDVLRFAQPGDKLFVLRFSKEGELTMSKPCRYCQRFIRQAQIGRVVYSDWEGRMVKTKF